MGEWRETVRPIVSKIEARALGGMGTSYSCKAAMALAHVLREMARIIDDEIDWRERGVREWRLLGWRIRLMRDE